jgi:probable phosphoglycerate mutase
LEGNKEEWIIPSRPARPRWIRANGGIKMIYLVRQGQTDWNLFKKCNGVTETLLNLTGIEQAKRLAENLRGVGFDACFCSPLIRARQTCEIIFSGKIVFDDRLMEIACGEFEGKDETADFMREFFQAIKSGDKGTETYDHFTNRNFALCEMIMQDYKGKNVLIVTHAANIRVIDYYFKGKPQNYDLGRTPVGSGGLLTYEN